MKLLDVINLLRVLDDRKAKEYLSEILHNTWESGYRRRIIDEAKISFFKRKNRMRLDQEIELLSEKYARKGYSGDKLIELVFNQLSVEHDIDK